MRAFQKSLPFLALAITTLAATGCKWDDSLYQQYVGEKGYTTSCTAYCEGADAVEQAVCTSEDVGGSWIEKPKCENLQADAGIITDETLCEEHGGNWKTGYCVIADKKGCDNAQKNWRSLDYKMMDFGNGQYIIEKSGEYLCGTFADLLKDRGEPCNPNIIREFEDSMRLGLCPDKAKYCVGFDHINNAEDAFSALQNIGICNSCPQNQIQCDGLCVDIINDPKHCGGCNACGENEWCENGECRSRCDLYEKENIGFCDIDSGKICVDLSTDPTHCGNCDTVCNHDEKCEDRVCTKACGENEISCYCDKKITNCSKDYREGTEILCLNPLANSTCGITECKDIESMTTSVCAEGTSCKAVRGIYQCVCPDDLVLYNDKCLNPLSIESCGVTENATSLVQCNKTSELCDGKECKCLQGTLVCDGSCVNLLNDNNHCGQCGKKCRDNESCVDGICQCPEGLTHCTEECLPVKNEKEFCGARGECNNPDPNSNDYRGEKCKDNFICDDDDKCVCPSPLVLCNNECIDPNINDTYCGASEACSTQNNTAGTNCKEIHPNSSCQDGKCKCDNKLLVKIIDGTPECIDVKTDPRCCGGNSIEDCSKYTCKISEGEVCQEGSCSKLGCPADKINCQGHCLNPKNDHVMYDSEQENSCLCQDDLQGQWCDDNDNPNDGCFGGKIGTLQHCSNCEDKCLEGYTACVPTSSGARCGCSDNSSVCKYKTEDDQEYVICTDLTREDLHMDDCGTCSLNWGNLDGDWINGCEADLSSNIEHCGSVEINCYEIVKNVPPSLIKCENGLCDYTMCQAGYDDCDADHSNGCEVSIIDNTTHCGSCKNSCKTYQKCLPDTQDDLSRQYCCFENGTGCQDCTLKHDACCKDQELKLWRQCSQGLFKECYCGLLIKDNYTCSKEQPGKCWEEVTSD